MASNRPTRELTDSTQPDEDDDDEDLLDMDEVGEEIQDSGDHPMEGDEDEDMEVQEELQFTNDSIAHFDDHTDSIFCIAQHPTNPAIIATGGGDDVGYIFDSTADPGPVLPSSYQSNPQPTQERAGLKSLKTLEGHTDSVNAIAFTLPHGEYVVTAGLDGKVRTWRHTKKDDWSTWDFVAEAGEVEEVNWLAVCPDPKQPNVVALGANDGSVWVYKIDAADKGSELGILMTQYLHTSSCTAGAWTPEGHLLATVSEDGTLNVWDVFETGQPVVSLNGEDQRFEVEGGLYSVACSSTLVAVGGAGGNIKVVGLPQKGDQAKKNKPGKGAQQQASSAGQILASLQAQSDGIETLSFSSPPLTLLAAGSVDGSIALFDTAHRFAVRRLIKEAHEELAVVKVDFVRNPQKGGWILTSAGMDGIVRRWDTRGGTTAAGQGFIKEWQGHRGDGEGGGILGFVQGGGGNRIVTAGDDNVSLVFRSELQ